ncbi:hypothetical protein [Shimia aestuarii]|uniref:Uncharacterized protein n=1 Tax=Shimia aestuarii TaxID=254406 RepID=A0A1I4R2B5_9RHOB|nr:hypothetical protein [Shimia aestuarii]SFM46438.1 hypothetical protein SAMN04488042_107230 [Shimia aestuarii]
MGRAKETRTTPEYVYCYARATVWLNTRIEGATIAKLISYKVTWPNSLVDILTKKDFNQRPSVINHFNKIGWNSKVKEQDADVHKDVGSRSSISYQSGRISCESAETIVTEATKLQHFDDFSVQPIFDVDFPTEIASTTLFPRKGAYVTEADIDRFFKTHLIEGGPLSEKSDSEHSTIGDFGTTGSPDASAP